MCEYHLYLTRKLIDILDLDGCRTYTGLVDLLGKFLLRSARCLEKGLEFCETVLEIYFVEN